MDRNLIDYLPNSMGDVREIKAITGAEQPEFVGLWVAAQDALDNQFVESATVQGVSRWEHILGIAPKATEELALRKFRVLTQLNQQLPYTIRTLEKGLENLCGTGEYVLTLQHALCRLTIVIGLEVRDDLENLAVVTEFVTRTIPANLELSIAYRVIWVGELEAMTLAQLAVTAVDKFGF